jgi:succinate dehydrogenase / fumarate reductase, membrane anchor subunit
MVGTRQPDWLSTVDRFDLDDWLWGAIMNMRSDLGKVRGLGSAKSGTEHFWMQRVSAIANVPLVTFLVWFIISHVGSSRAEFIGSVKHPLIAVGLLLAFASFFYHMRLGLQVVIEDYVHGSAKFAALLCNTFFAVILFATAAYAILKMSFGL